MLEARSIHIVSTCGRSKTNPSLLMRGWSCDVSSSQWAQCHTRRRHDWCLRLAREDRWPEGDSSGDVNWARPLSSSHCAGRNMIIRWNCKMTGRHINQGDRSSAIELSTSWKTKCWLIEYSTTRCWHLMSWGTDWHCANCFANESTVIPGWAQPQQIVSPFLTIQRPC